MFDFQINLYDVTLQPSLKIHVHSPCLTVKAVKASINVSIVSHKSCTNLWFAKKEK